MHAVQIIVFLFIGLKQNGCLQTWSNPLTAVYSCMKGTNQAQVKCIALQGEVGQQVSCSIYAIRSSTCKEVQIADDHCNKARLAHNLIPLINIEQQDSENNENYDQVC